MLITVFQSEFCGGSAYSPYYFSVCVRSVTAFRSNTKYAQVYKRYFSLNVNAMLKGISMKTVIIDTYGMFHVKDNPF